MKVITIKQPFATLIAEGLKEYEFRTWNTKFRGEVLIHAGKGIDKKAMKRYEHLNLDYPQGKIIAKAEITDCIYVDNDLKYELQKKNSLIYYGIINKNSDWNGYAFKLDKIKKIEPIELNGQLGFWNYYEPEEIMDFMNEIEYGWVDSYNNKNYELDDKFSDNYKLQSPDEIRKNKIGICWDQVELERYYFKNSGYRISTYAIVYYDNDMCPTHTFLVYEIDNKYYWFEHSWGKFKGIHKYENINDLLIDVKNKFIKFELDNKFNENNLILREYKKPKYNISVMDFYKHFESGKVISNL